MRLYPFIPQVILSVFLGLAPHSSASQSSLPIGGVAPLYRGHPATGGAPHVGRRYSIVFDLNSPAKAVGEPNPGLLIVAGLLNTYAEHGVSQSHRRFVVMLRDEYVALAERDGSYRQRHHGEGNVDIPLMSALTRAGVLFAVDASSLSRVGLTTSDLQDGIRVDVAASLTFLDLEAEGYVYTSTRSLQ